MIEVKIIKTEVIVNEVEFYNEIKRICMEVQTYNRSTIACNHRKFTNELGIKKMTELQFFKLCESCNIEIRRGMVYFDQFEKNE